MLEFKEINVAEAKKLIATGGMAIADIRKDIDYEEEHIPGALVVNDLDIDEFIDTVDKDHPVLCYCYHGFSSKEVAAHFIKNGFKKVYSLIGGFEAWKNEAV